MIVKFPNESQIIFLGVDDLKQMDKVLGIEVATILVDECTEITYEQWNILESRLAQKVHGCRNKMIACCNPTTISSWIFKYFVKGKSPVSGEDLHVTTNYLQMNPMDNIENIADGYISTLEGLSERQRKRFLLGEWLADIEGALWNSDLIEPYRTSDMSEWDRIIIGVDPAVTSKKTSDMTGIIVCGKLSDRYYVIDDSTIKGSPKQVTQKVLALRKTYDADKVVIETNQGGDWLMFGIEELDRTCPVVGINHRKSKIIRAEPISYLYERGLVSHCGTFTDLEGEMCSYTGNPNEESPDRLDALVIAMRELADEIQLDMTFGETQPQQANEERMWHNF